MTLLCRSEITTVTSFISVHFTQFLETEAEKPAQETSVSNTSHYCLRISQKRVKHTFETTFPLYLMTVSRNSRSFPCAVVKYKLQAAISRR
jgi:hypothetical protein